MNKILLLGILFFSLFASSCSNYENYLEELESSRFFKCTCYNYKKYLEDEENKIEVGKIAASHNAKEMLDELCIVFEEDCDDEHQTISRILNATPSTLERIRAEETLPTKAFEDSIIQIFTMYKILEKESPWYLPNYETIILRYEKDNECGGIIDFIRYLPWRVPLILLILAVFFPIKVLLAVFSSNGDSDYSSLSEDDYSRDDLKKKISRIALIVYGAAWFFSLFFSPDPIVDEFQNSTNIALEIYK